MALETEEDNDRLLRRKFSPFREQTTGDQEPENGMGNCLFSSVK